MIRIKREIGFVLGDRGSLALGLSCGQAEIGRHEVRPSVRAPQDSSARWISRYSDQDDLRIRRIKNQSDGRAADTNTKSAGVSSASTVRGVKVFAH